VISSFKSQQTWVRLILGSQIPLNSARVRIIVGDYGISSKYFSTLSEIPTDSSLSAKSSVNVAFLVIIFNSL